MTAIQGRPRVIFTEDDRLSATRRNALRWQYRQQGIPEDKIDEEIQNRKRKRQGKHLKKDLIIKMKQILNRIRNDVDELEDLTLIADKLNEFEGIITSSDSDN
jgi:hypothetical protein